MFMLTCKHVRRLLSDYLDNELDDPRLKERIDRHLAHCRKCALVFDATRKTVRLIADAEVFELPDGFSVRVTDLLAAAE